MKIITLSLITLAISVAANVEAQEVSGYEKIYYLTPDAIETDNFIINAKNAVAQTDHCKLGLKIENKSNDLIYYDPSESTMEFGFGTKNATGKPMLIQPNKSKERTLLVKGSEQYLQKSFKLKLTGMYRIPIDGKTIEAEDFKLPAAKNNFDAGNFEVTLKKFDASTKEAKAVFSVKYTGEGIGLVNPSNLSVKANAKKTNEEVVYANDYKKSDILLLNKGEEEKITAVFHIPGKIVDMQFATMYIQWNDTFVESEKEAYSPAGMVFVMDETLTNEKK